MIADSLGLAKSAVYYHYRSKDELVLGVLTPMLEQLPRILADAQARRGRVARADALIAGLVDLIVDQGPRYSVMTADPTVTAVIGTLPWLQEWYAGVVELIVGPDREPAALVALSMLLSSLTGPAHDRALGGLDREVLRQGMLDGARRLLGLPRRAAATPQ